MQLILDNQDNPPLRPVYSDNVVVYPRIFLLLLFFYLFFDKELSEISGPWTVAEQLRFFCNNVELRTHQQILQLFVELKEFSTNTTHQSGGYDLGLSVEYVTF